MGRTAGQKLKILYLLDYLRKYTDETHPVSTAELIHYLEENGIRAERRAIYDDVEQLCQYGYDIIQVQNRLGGGYYLAGREFEMAELKLLVDAVQSSRFITSKKSRDLIRKLEEFAGKHDAGKLQRQVYVAGRVKTENESIYYNIDSIHRAIQEKKQIRFCYMDWNLKKELVPRKNGDRKVSPWALIWREENYYLAAVDSQDGILKHFRVDKMGKVCVTEEKQSGMEGVAHLDPAQYANQVFGMFGGEKERVTLRFPNRLIGVVMDRFGREADVRPDGEAFFLVRTNVVVSGQFFGWLTGLGNAAQIVGPESVKGQYRNWLTEILDSEENKE